MLSVLGAILLLVLLLLAVLLLLSPGKPYPVVDATGQPVPGARAEKLHVPVNGVEQGIFIATKNPANPVLLFVHGGPGMPEYWLTNRYPTGLEDLFTVAWWEQRGSGLSYSASLPADTVTTDQLVADTVAVTNYLRQRFGQDKIYLMGHSGGSFIAIQAAARAPELYHAYIGVAQMGYQLRSEQLAYDYMLGYYRQANDEKMVRRLEAAPPTGVPLPAAYDALRDDAMHRAGVGTTRDMRSVITGVFVPSWLTPVYTLGEKIALWRGKFFSKGALRDPMFATDLKETVPALDLPVYFFEGAHDYTCAYPEAKAYFEKLRAPLKGFYTFEQSAHSPMFEEPARTLKLLREDVLAGTNRLADQD